MNDSYSQSSARGGRRAGAGRKRADIRPMTLRLPVSILDQVDKVAKNRAKFIREAVVEKLEKLKRWGI